MAEQSNGKSSMPPPPDPQPVSKILQPEVDAMSECLKNVVVKTAQIYKFYTDTYKLGIQKHALHPPRSLTAALGREVEKYDQLCDTVESKLLRTLAILKRDLAREERRVQAAQAKKVTPLPPVVGPLAELTLDTHITSEMSPPSQTPSSATTPFHPRRQSTISVSSLHRPAFPHKLDLSAATLRITPEEASLFSSALASPVTLAPKSARNEFPPELMAFAGSTDAGAIDMDLTVPDDDTNAGEIPLSANDIDMDTMGSTAEKPIELDLDQNMDMIMSDLDLFGDDTQGSLFNSPSINIENPLAEMNASSADLDLLDGFLPPPTDVLASFDDGTAETQFDLDNLNADFFSTTDMEALLNMDDTSK